MGTVSQIRHQVDEHRQAKLHIPGPRSDTAQPLITGSITFNSDFACDNADNTCYAGLGLGGYVNRDNVFFCSTQNSECSVRRYRGPFLAMIEVIRELDAALLLPRYNPRCYHRVLLHDLPQTPQKSSVFAELFDQYIPRSVQRFLYGLHRS